MKKMDNKIKKESYVPPMLQITFVEMEQGIATGSVSANPGTSGSPNAVQAEDWSDQGATDPFGSNPNTTKKAFHF